MKFRDIDLSDNALNAEHLQLGIPPLERNVESIALADAQSRTIKIAVWIATTLLIILSLYVLSLLIGECERSCCRGFYNRRVRHFSCQIWECE